MSFANRDQVAESCVPGTEDEFSLGWFSTV